MLPGQLSLDWEGRARHADPETSKAAGARAKTFAGKQHVQILNVLRTADRPMAAEEIGDALGLDNVKTARRISELLRPPDPAIHAVDSEYVNRSGSKARRYRIASA